MVQTLEVLMRNPRAGSLAPDASSAHQLFHEWVTGNHTRYRSAIKLSIGITG
ncbi:hypothetical protein P5G61_27645 [Paenibacillus sp. F6_3S_P_1C]|uniref:Uncharacterized protein n=1 Tax=Paenibacillus vandeheii TaxID=3035917 RepID=A0ABT8JIR4_9BACL|nr:hypothetical protein [Paenibacillus vandeheii]MDN4605030.1 hypothetical protein [Paenibacillus vandeheii]